ncbi:substrate-binding domain-containing protein [Bradyrhizobium glycinis]|uniref:substrate-binding domain-containing protein n=1 Tax=Bradyrhizobium glycinis TaxID=2751812 RepID=UPI0018D618A1|nr:substrate-binding domain-containing protein [Bradyrhizobium glycinis]MBH5370485.1 substrate-binding domain-containing protein [Bradyrhizobium glycinis]
MIKLGLLVAETGATAIWTPSAIACAQLAVAELNQAGGVLGHHIELTTIDSGPTGETAAEAAANAVAFEGIAGIVGMVPSYCRRPVTRAIGRTVPFIYTPQFEGFEDDARVVTTGETSSELLAPALRMFQNGRRDRRCFLCGNDYMWPRGSIAIARAMIQEARGTITGEMYLPLGSRDYDEILSRIASTRSDVVLPFFLGSDAIHFNRAFAAAGLTSRADRFACAVDETIIYGLAEHETENLYISSAYFSSLRSHNNGAFLERYHTLHGDSPPPANAFGQSCYEGVHCFAALVAAAETTRADSVRGKVGRALQARTARGKKGGTLAGSSQPIYLGRVDGYEVSILSHPI